MLLAASAWKEQQLIQTLSLSPDSWLCSEPWWTGWRMIKTGDCLISHDWCRAFGSLSWDRRSCRRCDTALLHGQSLTLFSVKLHNVHQLSSNRCRTVSCCSGVQEGKQCWKLWNISCMVIGEHQTANHEHRTRYIITDSCRRINQHSWKIQLLHKINKKAKLVILSQLYTPHTQPIHFPYFTSFLSCPFLKNLIII